jgi:carboxyl-terminal processing protease
MPIRVRRKQIMVRFLLTTLFCFLLLFPVGNGARAEKVALVVGINKYDHLGSGQQLQRAVNDARSIAEALRRLGFKVEIGEDLDRSTFNRMWQSFLDRLSPGDVAVVYYSGHGIELEGYNFLIPRDVPNISFGRQEQLRRESLSVAELLLDLKRRAPQISLVILDACRDNPFIPAELRSAGKRGLASVSDPPEGTFIMYSAGAGETALDRLPSNDPDSTNSVYTRHLLQLIKLPGLTLPNLARQLRVQVRDVASTIYHVQRPAYYDGLIGHYCVAGCDATASRAKPGLPLSSALMAARGAGQRQRVAALLSDKDLKVPIDVMGDVIEKLRENYVELPSDRALMTSAIEAIAKQFGNNNTQALVEKGIGDSAKPKSMIEDADYPLLDVFGDVLEEALQSRTSVDSIRAVAHTAIVGMLNGLDAHGAYYDAENYRRKNVASSGSFGGIGLEVRKLKDKLQVVAPLDESPAARAGILTNDRITHINGEAVDDFTLEQSVERLRGQVNTSVTVTLLRDGQKAPVNVTIVRSIIINPGVKFRLEADNTVGYIKISQYNQQTRNGLIQAVKKLQSLGGDKIKGYIVDLRNNSGGLLDVAIAVTDEFLEKGQIGTLKGRNAQEIKKYPSTPGDILNGQKLIVLINEGTASGAEIMASALKDNKRAIIVGVRSYGKASVQTLYPLRDKSVVQLTTQRYFAPSGPIENRGVQPNVKIEKINGGGVDLDAQLQKAIELAAAN